MIKKLIHLFDLAFMRFKKYPMADWAKPLRCTSFYIWGTGKQHDSGYQCMKLLCCLEDGSRLIKTIGSDVLHFSVAEDVKRSVGHDCYLNLINIDMDMFGNTQFFINNGYNEFEIGHALSSCEIRVITKEKKNV